VLYEFPVVEVNVDLPSWVETLEADHWLRQKFSGAIAEAVAKIKRVRDIEEAIEVLEGCELVRTAILAALDLGTGVGRIQVVPRKVSSTG